MAKKGWVGLKTEGSLVDLDARERLLLAAGQLMAERRSVDVTLADIAERSGLTGGLVRYYFGNKAGLFVAMLRDAMGPLIKQMDHLVALPISPRDKLRIHISGMVNAYFRFPYMNKLIRLLLTENRDEYGLVITEEFGKPVARAQAAILEAGVADGSLRPVDPAMFYIHVVGACEELFYAGFQLQSIFGIAEIDEEQKNKYINYLCTVILSGIVIPQPA